MASSSIVIKVRFGEMLRRLNASINDKKLVFDMATLKEKIRCLFSFGSDVEFTMTYVDEDGDEVTLADDGDLLDVVRQSLNPLRITVNLKGSNFSGPSGNSTSLKATQNQYPFQTLNPEVPEILTEVLAKLSLDLASKASAAAPVVAELVEKMKGVYSNQILPSMASPSVPPTTRGPPNVNSELSTVKNSKVPVTSESGGSNSNKKEKQVQKATEDVKFKDVQPPRGIDLNVPLFDYGSIFKAPISSTKSVGEGSTGKNKDTTDGVQKNKDSSSEKKDNIGGDSLNEPLKHDSFVERFNQVTQNQTNQWQPLQYQLAAQRAQARDQLAAERARFAQIAADINKKVNDSGSASGRVQGMLNATNQCPFSGTPLVTDSNLHGHPHSPYRKRYNFGNNNMSNTFHRGIICDGCGVHPITGPRFKSKVKLDYDLCSICFAEMGNATDYIRMDHPTNSFIHHLMSTKAYDSSSIPPPGAQPYVMRAPEFKLPRSKLDSQFIVDVNVLDETIMAPSTAFTKIWRMRNNGSINWPCGSQLQWVEGDCLCSSPSADVEIPVDGLPVDKELDISVNFTAPGLPGRYVSYWMMASPSGQKFGQRIWVIIQVDASMKNSGETSINLNLPPPIRDPKAVNQDHLIDNIISGDNIITDPEYTSGYLPPKDHRMKSPINDSMMIDNDGVSSTMATVSAPPETASSSVFNSAEVGTALGSLPAGPTVTSGLDSEPISYPTVDFSVMPPIMSSGAASLPTVVVQPSGSGSGVVTDDQEQALVKDLEAMGFTNLDLNKEILRMNNYDLEKSIDDICGVLEWDPMLDELREMGFADDEANRRLLKKNNGSIKGVVMDLINEEKA